eukprot:21103-Heterococcus_DN1.PRE.3
MTQHAKHIGDVTCNSRYSQPLLTDGLMLTYELAKSLATTLSRQQQAHTALAAAHKALLRCTAAVQQSPGNAELLKKHRAAQKLRHRQLLDTASDVQQQQQQQQQQLLLIKHSLATCKLAQCVIEQALVCVQEPRWSHLTQKQGESKAVVAACTELDAQCEYRWKYLLQAEELATASAAAAAATTTATAAIAAAAAAASASAAQYQRQHSSEAAAAIAEARSRSRIRLAGGGSSNVSSSSSGHGRTATSSSSGHSRSTAYSAGLSTQQFRSYSDRRAALPQPSMAVASGSSYGQYTSDTLPAPAPAAAVRTAAATAAAAARTSTMTPCARHTFILPAVNSETHGGRPLSANTDRTSQTHPTYIENSIRICNARTLDNLEASSSAAELIDLSQQRLAVVRAVVLHNLRRVAGIDGHYVLLQLAPHCLIQLLQVLQPPALHKASAGLHIVRQQLRKLPQHVLLHLHWGVSEQGLQGTQVLAAVWVRHAG